MKSKENIKNLLNDLLYLEEKYKIEDILNILDEYTKIFSNKLHINPKN